ncbi:hypothetical protein MNBD_UNCLBAC01-2113 [hydrothermal vent metagenome]|uniref:SPOR domain-containing protein n=1 Tax=hydrothermal vent metagenome TaxID=652676 RepID=A0A3B1DJG6_9ZZZZ
MRNSVGFWIFIGSLVVIVLATFHYQKNKEVVPLSEIFPDEETIPVDVEYEFVETKEEEPETIQVSEKVEKIEQVEVDAKEEVIVPVKEVIKEPVKAVVKNIKGSFTIQVASFKKKDSANKKLAELAKKGYDTAYIASRDLGAKGVWYRVYIGNFETKSLAQKFLVKVKSDYKGSFIIKK